MEARITRKDQENNKLDTFTTDFSEEIDLDKQIERIAKECDLGKMLRYTKDEYGVIGYTIYFVNGCSAEVTIK